MDRTALPRPLRTVTHGVFRLAASARRARAFHPRGITFAATVDVLDESPRLAARPGRHQGLVRFSRGAGLPSPLPDVHGLALKIVDAHGSGLDQDLLLVVSGRAPVARHLILPVVALHDQWLSSVLPYRHRGRLVVLGARRLPPARPAQVDELPQLAERGELRFEIVAAGVSGAWRPLAELRVGQPCGAEVDEALQLSPWNTGEDLQPAGLLNALRDPAYLGSEMGRGAPPSG